MKHDEKINCPSVSMREWVGSAILLVDLDAFFASVEQLDHPEWRGTPVIVGGLSAERGVVSTCSYEARTFGVRSAMASSVAEKLCPSAHWVKPRMSRYQELSKQVMQILKDESPYVQQVSIDEAFVDVTPGKYNKEHPLFIAQRIQQNISLLGITCSIGLSASKTVSKIASEQGKPRGLVMVYPQEEEAFLRKLPISAMSGIGSASVSELHKFGIKTLGDLSQAESDVLRKVFGKNAELFRQRALGHEISEVSSKGR